MSMSTRFLLAFPSTHSAGGKTVEKVDYISAEGKDPYSTNSPVYDTKLYLMVRLLFRNFGEP